MGEGRRRGGVREVVRRHVNGLDGSNGPGLGGGDPLLEHAHLFREGRLVTHGGRHPAEEGRHFRPREGVTIDVIHEEEHVPAFVPKLLGERQTRERHAETVARGLVHLTEDQGDLVENVGILHFVVEVVPFPGPLSYAREYGQTGVFDSDVPDQLKHGHGLTHPGTAEEANLTALREGANEVDNLDARLEDFHGPGLIFVGGGSPVDRHAVRRVHRTLLVDGFAEHVHDPAEGLLTHGDGDRCAGVLHGQAAGETFGSPHGNGPNHAVPKLLLHLKGELGVGNPKGVIHLGHFVALELDVDDGANDLNDSSAAHDARFLSNDSVMQA